jgi:ribosome-associated protein
MTKKQLFYDNPQTSTLDSFNLVKTIAQAADEKKAADLVILNVEEICYLADYFVIATGFSKAQVRAIANSIEKKLVEEWEKSPRQMQGLAEASWIVQDYGDVIVHLFLPEEREFYNLEAFWGHAEKIDLSCLNYE